ncbi:phospholipase A-2-activating protein-like [Babylonia areolata]|uniref:phospholipase A-2-activating protein-like n=1 Tax=Babylonia areolata TaxID=304850 RepID=UPI003FD2ABA0
MAAPYKLRCNVVGHKKDVRALAPALLPEGGIVSGSRDCTTCVWLPNEHNPGFTEGQVLQGHSNFVAAVCVLPPDDTHPEGLIATGSNDSTILLFAPGELQPVAKLTGHTSTVCALSSGKFGFLLSGSWDKTARVWLNQKTVMTLEGHESAVWAVATMSEKGVMLTASADKTIKSWKAGKVEHTFVGHEDCVRGLAVVDDSTFLSCSNDATIRRWLTTGDCIGVYYGHSNYVYSLALLPNGSDFVTSGEDRTVRVWQDGECVQTIPHPTQSVWCVTALNNGDIVTGASDGVMRVFTREAGRMASEEDQKALEELIASSTIPTELGDINKEDLPGPEALINPGRKEGQTKMVRQGDKIELYSWDQAQAQWTKVGDVVGSSGGSQATSGKTLFEGKEYDYVFSVDIEEGKPPLKLPYNVSEDPWHAAQAFLHRYNLSQLFLDQVANFIVQNAKGISPSAPTGSYADPFTGSNRYVPGSGGGASGDTHQVGRADPFTGANSYQPQASGLGSSAAPTYGADPFTGSGSYKPAASTAPPPPSAPGNSFFPVTSFLTLDTVNPKAVIAKLQEFNKTVEEGQQVNDAAISELQKVLEGQPSESSAATLQKLLEWPEDKIFPALDVLRMGAKQSAISRHFCQQPAFLTFLCKCLAPGSPAANQMLTLRTMANLFCQPEGAKLLGENQTQLLEAITSCQAMATKNAQIAQSTAVLNFSLAATALQDFERKSECITSTTTLLGSEKQDGEATFRLLVALGTLTHGDEMSQAVLHSLDFVPRVRQLKETSDLNKVIECADLLVKQL